jgi:hypothetical protein
MDVDCVDNDVIEVVSTNDRDETLPHLPDKALKPDVLSKVNKSIIQRRGVVKKMSRA